MKHMSITSLLPVTNKFSWRQRRKGDFPRRGLDFCVFFRQPHQRRNSSSSASLSSVTWAGDAVFQEEQLQGACEHFYQQNYPSSIMEK